MDLATKDKLVKIAEDMFNTTERVNRMSLFKEIAHYMMPAQEELFSTSGQNQHRGSKSRYAELSTSVPIMMARDLANAWHTMFCNPTLKFISVEFGKGSDVLNDSETARDWLKQADELVYEKAIVDSNFHAEMAKDILNDVLFGNSATLQEFIAGEFIYNSVHLANVAFRENFQKKIDQTAIRSMMYRRDIIDKFGIDVQSTPDVAMLDDKELHSVVMFIYPRPANEIKIDPMTGTAPPTKRPFGCIYYLERGRTLLLETGYYENPLIVGRLEQRTGETYGNGIGEVALTDVKKLNKVDELSIKGRETRLLPVIFIDSDLDVDVQELERIEAGSIIRVPNLQSGSIQEFASQADVSVQELTIERLERNLRSIFFLDKLELPPRDTVGEQSAYEVQQRLAQMQRFMGGTALRRLDKIKDIYKRAFYVFYREGLLPPLPAEMQNAPFAVDIIFTSSITRNLEYERIDNIRIYLTTLAEFVNLTQSPSMTMEMEARINYGYIISEVAKISQLDPQVLYPEEIAQQNLQAMREQQRQQALEQQIVAAGQAAGALDKQ